MKHSHFDVEAVIAQLVRDRQATHAEGMKRARTDNDRRLVQLQIDLGPFVMAFHRWHLEAHNSGIPEHMQFGAFSGQLADVVWSFSRNMGGEPHVNFNMLMGLFAQMIKGMIEGHLDGGILKPSQVAPMPGSRA